MNGRNLIGIALRIGVCLGLVFTLPAAWAVAKEGQKLFEKRCSACHALPDINNPPPEGWAKRLQQMAPLAKLKGDQKDAVLDYLSSHVEDTIKNAALSEDKAFFEEKCSRCHTLDRILLEPLTEESRRHVVSRMQARSGTDWLSDEDVERVLGYLSTAHLEAPSPPEVDAGATGEELFAARCQTCHTMERISVHLSPDHLMDMDWSHVVNRMRGKAPQWMTEAESKRIAEYLQSLSANGNGG